MAAVAPPQMTPPSTIESWRLGLWRGDPVEVRSASARGWLPGTVIAISPDRVKVEYVFNGERCDKVLLRSSPDLSPARITPTTMPVVGPNTSPQGASEDPCVVPSQRKWVEATVAPPTPHTPKQTHAVPIKVAIGCPQGGNSSECPLSFSPNEWLRVSDLHIGDLLGSGGFGAVYRGRLRGEEVAIKQLHLPDGGQMSVDLFAEFQKEVCNLQVLRHPRLIRFIGVALEPPILCIATEFAAGGSLYALLHVQRVPLPEARRRTLVLQIVEGVAFLHSRQPPCVHRDLKSANVVLDAEFNAKLCDFGLTESMERTHISRRETEAGSPRYMAPEVFDARCKLTEKLDVWAMGCLIVEVLKDRVPHEDCTTLQQVAAKLLVRMEGPFTDDCADGLRAEVWHLATRCFERHVESRPHAASLFEELGRLKTFFV